MQAAPKTIIVTGGAGFIGSCAIRRWLAETNWRIVCVDRLTYAASLEALATAQHSPRFVLETADVADGPAMQALVARTGPDAVVHLAAETHVDRSIDDASNFVRANLLGTYELLEAARLYWRQLPPDRRASFRYLQVSTDEVFGSAPPDGRFDEGSAYAPNSPYSATKAGADHLVRAWHKTYGLPTITSYSANNFGPYQFPEKLIPHAILCALKGRPIPIYGDGRQVRDWIHVDDHAAGLRAVLEHGQPGERYCIGAAMRVANLDLIRRVCEILDELRPASESCARLITHVGDRPGHDRRYALDSSKIARELGWHPRKPFDAALRETVAWYLDHVDWLRQRGAAST